MVRNWLIDTRKKLGMTQGEVAERVGIAQPSYCEIENGASRPRPETAKKIGNVLGVAWVRFYEEEEGGKTEG